MNTATETSDGPAPGTQRATGFPRLFASQSVGRPGQHLPGGPDVQHHLRQRRALETLRGIEDEIRKAFDVDVDDIVGATHPPLPQGQAARGAHPAQPGRLAAPGRVQLRQHHAPGQDQRRLRPEQRRPRLHRQLGRRQPAPAHRSRAIASGVHAGERADQRADGRPRPEDHLRQPGLAGHSAQAGTVPARQAREVLGSTHRCLPQGPGLPAQDPLQRQEPAGAGQYQDRPRDGRPARHRHLRQEQELPRAHGHLGADHRASWRLESEQSRVRVNASRTPRPTCSWPTAT